MHGSRVSSRATSLAIALFLSAPVLLAQTTSIDVELGESFSGTIDQAGVDTVEARFSADAGQEIRLTVEAVKGSTLQPTVRIEDSAGSTVSGSTQHVAWLPVGNAIHYFTTSAAGQYVAVIGGASGSGEFLASLSGTPPVSGGETVPVSGAVTDGTTQEPIEGVDVLVDDAPFATTDANGLYSGQLAPGSYTAMFQADGYETLTRAWNVTGPAFVSDVSLTPAVSGGVEASVSGDAVPGGSLTATVDIQVPPGTNVTSIQWSQVRGAPAMIVNGDTDTATVTLGSLGDYKDELAEVLREPPVGAEQLPPHVPLPPGEFAGGLQNRLEVVAVNPFALEEAGLVVLEVEVVTEIGTFTDEVEIHAPLPWKVSTGLRDVPQGVPVLVQAVEAASYDWTFSMIPAGSLATLNDASTRYPYFTPDVPGLYELEVSDGAARAVSTLQVHVGTWRGVIVGEDMNGRPVSDTACTFCHNDILAPDKFVEWAETGHAEIFTENLNTSSHYSTSCFACHTVGYDPDADNGGVDDASDYQDFLDAGLLSNPDPDNWATVLEDFPETARLSNAQCENCHGPQDSNAHGFASPVGEPRVNLSAEVCGSCHGEPLRHGRFQQWQLSGHANYELAIDEGENGSCARCHTANGFLAWVPILTGEEPGDPLANINVTWTAEETHPQTCAACHDPHMVGTTSGDESNARVRISGDTPPLLAGFTVTDVGRGALCMTCHNSRNGLRNDSTFDDFSVSEKARAPHGAAQTDVLVGQNAYFVAVDDKGGHAMLEETCVDCHMAATEPPDILSYDQGGTNHTFYADPNICADCHSPYLKASDVQNGIQSLLDQVGDLLGQRLFELIEQLIADGNKIDLNGDVTITDSDVIAGIEFGETHGRHAITVTFTDQSVSGPHRVTDVDVLDAGDSVIGTLYDFADDAVPKAGWNWNLFNNDGSLGVHNPFFAMGALTAARDALVALSPSSARVDRDPAFRTVPSGASEPRTRPSARGRRSR